MIYSIPRCSHTSRHTEAYFGHFFHPRPCPLCFQVCIICGISNIAFLLFSNLPFMDLSHSFPFTFCPTPVPLTLNPFSSRLLCFSTVPFTVKGSNSSTPCWRASFTSSACLRRLNTGSCHLPVTGCFCALKGFDRSGLFGIGDALSIVGSLGSVEEVFEAKSTGLMEACGVIW